eukprot:c21161_g2_i1 orf=70-2631(+)
MAFLYCVLFLFLQLSSLGYGGLLQDTERDALLQLRIILENPISLTNWSTETDFCNLPLTPTLSIVCEGGFVTHLQVVGSRASASCSSQSCSNGMLSAAFSSESLCIHLINFSRLKVLQLSSLGIWGPLPSKLGRLSYLETLNMSSNFLWGVLPNRLMSLQSLQIVALDDNMLNGSLPQKWSSLPQLSTLSLSSNKIQGQLPASLFSQLPSLKNLVLDRNLLSGHLPGSLSNASTLQALSLSGNAISGNLPDLQGLPNLLALNMQDNQIGPQFPSLAPKLLYLALGKNKLQGPIPSSITHLSQLQQLDLSSNLLSGVPPPAFFSLASIKFLNVARNHLSGSLLSNLTISSSVKMLDFSFNLLTGQVPAEIVALVTRGGAAAIRFEWNCLSTSLQPQNPFTYCQNAALASGIDPHLSARQHNTVSKGNRVGILAGVTAGVLALAVASLLLLFVVIHRKRSRSAEQSLKATGGGPCMGNKSVCVSSELLANARYISRTLKLGALGLPQFRVFSMDELYKATEYFHESSLIGQGSRGKVYKGQLDDGLLVAIKRLNKEHVSSIGKLKARIEHLAKFRHQHLVSLLGYNLLVEGDSVNQGGAQVYLIYEYVSNRTLQTRLAGRGQDGFGWLQRLLAIIGAAKGIHFLHSGSVPGIFNNGIKIRNVLVDQNLIAKVSDYGLASPLDVTEDNDGRSQINNSFSPAEKQRKKLVDKNDVYNFGLVLLEVLVGKPLTLHDASGRPKVLEPFIAEQGSRLEVIDPKILGVCNMESLETVMEITAKCLSPDVMSRPSMEDVLWNLQYALQVQDSSNGGSQEDFGEGLYASEVHAIKGRKNTSSVGKVSSEEIGKPSSPNADFFR